MRKSLLFIILLLGFLLRVVWLDKYPSGFTPDEASFGYDAYSLLRTGADQWGVNWPLAFRSFGDFKLPLYAYLTIPSIAIFDLNEFSTRLPSAIIGTLAVFTTFLLASKLFNWRVGVLAAFLLAVSPWHVPLSRGAFEANLTVFFMSAGSWLFLEGIRKPKLLLLSALFLGLNLFTYHSARLLTPLIGLALLILYKKDLLNIWANSRVRLIVALSVFGLFLALTIYTIFSGSMSRGADIAVFNPTDNWSGLSDERYGSVLSGLPDSVARIFSNKVTYTFREFTRNYLSYLSPQFLFTHGAGEWTYGMVVGHGVLYLFEIINIGLFVLIIARGEMSREKVFIIAWMLMSIIPAALTKGPGYAANRVAVMMPSIQIASALGGNAFLDFLSKKRIRGGNFLIVVIVMISFFTFLYNYFYSTQKSMRAGMLAGRKEIVELTVKAEYQNKDILLSKRLSEPHIYVAFYTKWDPTEFQKASQDWLKYEEDKLKFVDQLGVYRLGRYTFRDIHYPVDDLLPNTLVLPRNENK